MEVSSGNSRSFQDDKPFRKGGGGVGKKGFQKGRNKKLDLEMGGHLSGLWV